MVQWMLAVWSVVPLRFSKSSLNIWKFTIHVLLKPGLENFEHCFTSVWNECNCVVVWAFFGIAFLWNWNENWPFPALWPLLSFPNVLAYWVQHFHSIIFQDLSPPLTLFVVMLPKAHLTSQSRMSGSRWVITSLWLSGKSKEGKITIYLGNWEKLHGEVDIRGESGSWKWLGCLRMEG